MRSTIVAFYRKIFRFGGFFCSFVLLFSVSSGVYANVPELTIDNRAQIALEPHASYLRDPSRALDASSVAQQAESQWRALGSNSLTLGFTRDAVWLRFRAGFAPDLAASSGRRLLVVDNTLMSQAQLFVRSANGTWLERPALATPSGGATLHRMFEIAPSHSTPIDYLLRIESAPSMASSFSVWQDQAWLARHEKKEFLLGAAYGGYVLLIALYAGFSVWTRDRMHLAYTLYITANFGAALLASAWPRILWPHHSAEFWASALGVGISLPVVLGTWFGVLMLNVRSHWPRIASHVLAASAGVTLLGVLGSILGFYVEVAPLVMAYLVVLLATGLFLSLKLALRGDRSGRLFLLAFGLYSVGLIARVLRNLMALDFHVWIDQLYQAGTFMHMLVMSVGIFATYSRLKTEAQAARTELEAQEKLRLEQRDFLTLVSHELRNPMAIISASTDNMARDASLSETVKTRVLKIQRASQRIQELMEQFLSNERLLQDSHRLRHADHELRSLCKAAAMDLPEAALPLLAWKNGDPVALCCDGELVKVAVYNLLINAWRHSPAGSTIEVTVDASDALCRVEVADRGPGISPEDLQHLFRRFYRGTQSVDKPGTGLGLYLVKTIAERHGGQVQALPRKGGGSLFVLTLPRQQSPAKLAR